MAKVEQNIVVLGPSKVGKTALIAGLKQAADIFSLHNRNSSYHINLQPSNEITRELFTQVLTLLSKGHLPFQGTQDILDYQLTLTMQSPKDSWLSSLPFLKSLFNPIQTQNCTVQFPDAPGGALFHGDDDEVDDVVMAKYRNILVKKLQTGTGLLICIDGSVNTQFAKDQKYKNEVAMTFAKWLPNLFATVSQDVQPARLPVQRVVFVLTKMDLWAEKHQWKQNSSAHVLNADPYNHAKEILGQLFFNSIRNHFHENTTFAFCMSSTYGFKDGAPNATFLHQTADSVTPDDWIPLNIIEPFIYLLTGHNIQKRLQTLSWSEMGS